MEKAQQIKTILEEMYRACDIVKGGDVSIHEQVNFIANALMDLLKVLSENEKSETTES